MKKYKNGSISFKKLQNSLTIGSHLESISPQIALLSLKDFLQKSPDFNKIKDIYLKNETFSLNELRDCVSKETYSELKNHIDRYGYRNFNDLKLEGSSFKENIILLLKLVLQQDLSFNRFGDGRVAYKEKMSFFEQSVFYREKARLLRSEYISWFRDAFLKISKNLCAKGIIFNKSDIFYLSLEDLKILISSKKELDVALVIEKQKRIKKSLIEYPEFIITENDKIIKNTIISSYKNTLDSDEAFGLFVSGESVSGEVLVVMDPEHVPKGMDLSDKILITETTDPAWVFYMSQCRALVSERGGLLSHTAIIGRELNKTTLVKVDSATKIFKNGDMVHISLVSQSIKKITNE